MKNILVTGADGFIGSHLTDLLLSKGYKVTALSMYNSFNNIGWLEDIKNKKSKNLNILSGDIRDYNFCEQITAKVDTVFHLAALIAIPYSYIALDSYFETNVKGTLNICQAARKNKVKRIIHTSTSEVYGSAEYVPIDEKHPLKAQSPYSASKIGAEAVAMSFFYSFDLPITVARPFNTFGPRQSARAVIPTIITQIISKNKTLNIGNTSTIRNFNYVEDICYGFIGLAKNKNTIGKIINIGSDSQFSIKEVLDLIKKIMKSNIKVKINKKRIRPKYSEVSKLSCDNSLIKELTKFKPKVKFEDGLKKTIKWFLKKENIKNYKTDIYNL